MDETKWRLLMDRIGISANKPTYDRLVSFYQEPHRHYHNLSHLNAVLNHLEESKHIADDPNAVEIALWFHDVIYKPLSSNNELDSANWARDFLLQNQVSEKFASKVHALIMATLHDASPAEKDSQLLVDIDLSILGSDASTYSDFESQVRREYRFVPSFVYKKKRAEILSGFLNREQIYSIDFYYQKFEELARKNLARTIEQLKG